MTDVVKVTDLATPELTPWPSICACHEGAISACCCGYPILPPWATMEMASFLHRHVKTQDKRGGLGGVRIV